MGLLLSLWARLMAWLFGNKVPVIIDGKEVMCCLVCPHNQPFNEARFCPPTHRCDNVIDKKGDFEIIYNPRGILKNCPGRKP